MGQNALQQAKMFKEALPLSGFLLTKFDRTSRSGVVLSICEETRLPFFALGEGEKRSDLSPFDPDRFLDKLLSPS
jgi:fused signal recognition particle receptor